MGASFLLSGTSEAWIAIAAIAPLAAA